MNETDIRIFKRMRRSPVYFVYYMFRLRKQRKGEAFEKGKHITQHQWEILHAVEEALAGRASKKISIKSGHGCHARGTDILMFDGTIKKVEDVVQGDRLMGDDSTPRTVLSLARGSEQMYRIRYHDGSYYDVNESHILSLVASQTHSAQKRGAKQNVSVREYLSWSDRKKRTHVGYKVSVDFPQRQLPINPYLLGLWLGDGTSAKGEITNEDEEIITYLRDEFSSLVTDKRNKTKTLRVPGLITELRRLGLRNNKHIPHEYKTSSTQQRYELLAGIIDTDGFNGGNDGFEIIQKNRVLAEDIVFLARSLGHHATINSVQKTCTNSSKGRATGTYWKINISRKTWLIPTRIERKKVARPEKPQRERLHFGFTVEKLSVDDYYGFELDGNHLYLLGDFTVTHNTGKSATMSWLILWYLFCFKNAQVPCTANTAPQLHDVLWKELSLWLGRMPKDVANLYEWQSGYLRVKESPATWFARARTARKENPEALAGIHAEHVMFVVDEASGVPDEVFRVAEGSLTGENVLVLLISNPTRLIGYFYDTHHSEKDHWQTLTFNSEDSPIVDKDFVDGIIRKHGKDSDEYRIRVLGEFPKEDAIDDKGYVPLLVQSDLREVPFDGEFKIQGMAYLGVDPSGEGDDETVWVLRDGFRAMVVAKEKVSDEKGIAQKTITLMDFYNVPGERVTVDNFGIGANVAKEIAWAGFLVNSINVGEKPSDEQYLNARAENYYRLRQWLRSGGELIQSDDWQELLTIRYRRTLSGKLQIMPKLEMRKEGYPSPNVADALMLTFGNESGRTGTVQAFPEYDPYDIYG